MKRILRQPPLWLIVQAVTLVIAMWAAGRLSPVRQPDTATYEQFDWSSVSAVWSNIRTPGYPLFLAAADRLAPDHAAVPLLQLLILILAVWALYAGLRGCGYRQGVALACASTFYYRDDLLRWTSDLLADSLAASLALVAVSCFLAAGARDRAWRWWMALGLLTLVTCLVRPAYLFLVPLWPLLAWFFDRLVWRRDQPRARALRKAAALLVGMAAPLLAVCALRWTLVGHFGFVSFGGYNVIGIAGQLLDESLARQLPTDQQPLAEEILRARAQHAGYEPPASFLAMERMYNVTVWELAVPAARQLCADDTVAVNRALNELSWEVLRRRPAGYLRWLCLNAAHAVSESARLLATNVAVLATLALFCGLHAWRLYRRHASILQDPRPEVARARFHEAHLLFWTALLYWLANCGLVVPVEPTIFRYMVAGNLLLPAALACFVAHAAESTIEPTT